MSGSIGRRRSRRSSGSERVFEDQEGRLWSAARTTTPGGSDVVVFTCVSDSREAPRALATDAAFRLTESDPEALRHLLRRAPRLSQL
jgi:hypothetical protein